MQSPICNWHLTDDSIEAAQRSLAYITTPRQPPSTFYAQQRQARHASLEDVAAVLGVSRERARQIERDALQKCRAWCERNGYDLPDLLGL